MKFLPSQPSLRFVVKYLRNFSISLANSCRNCGHYDIRLLWTLFPFFSLVANRFSEDENAMEWKTSFLFSGKKSMKGVKSTNNCSFFSPSSSRPFDWSTMKIIGRKSGGRVFLSVYPKDFRRFHSLPNRMSKQTIHRRKLKIFLSSFCEKLSVCLRTRENKGLKVLNESDKKCKSFVIP